MANEILIALSLAVSYGALLLFWKFFGKAGCVAWVAVSTILANIEVAVLVTAFGMEQTLGNTLFASSFLATDILSETSGKRDADSAVWAGALSMLVFMLFSILWRFYEPSQTDAASPHLRALFERAPRVLFASFVSFAASEFLDVRLYHLWWNFTSKKFGSARAFLWLRNNASTLVSQALNIVLFNALAFAFTLPARTLASVTLSCYAIYVATSLLDTPFIYIARSMKPRDAA